MSDLTYTPIGLRAEDKERIAAIRAARPGLDSTAAVVRAAIEEMAASLAKPKRRKVAR